MRIQLTKHFAFFIVFLNIVIIYYTWKLFQSLAPFRNPIFNDLKLATRTPIKHVSKLTTIVIRDFELQENDITGTVQSFLKVFPNIQILIVTNGVPYPPLQLNYLNSSFKNVKVINLSPNLNTPYQTNNPLNAIKTKFALFMPDSSRILHRQSVQFMVNYLNKQETDQLVVVPFSHSKNLTCFNLNFIQRDWTLKFNTSNDLCDFVGGKHAIMLETKILYKLNNPFLLPHPHSLYLQTAHFKYKVKILQGVHYQDGKPLFHSHHAQRQKQKMDTKRIKALYESYSIKHVIKENWYRDNMQETNDLRNIANVVENSGSNRVLENYGCTRETQRCFGPIINYTPSYIYENKTTPPCCLSNLRKTARHVFASLQEAGIRYWLESGSLLGAMSNNDVIPWDYDVDIGFNRDDLNRCVWLRKAKNKPTIDTKGFLWERATEGNFYKIYFSKINKMFVNLFPFYAKNGTMTKDAWSTRHKNMEFPDHFLHPMSSIEFMGIHVPCPNNIRDFLELKFGKDIVDNQLYPELKFTLT